LCYNYLHDRRGGLCCTSIIPNSYFCKSVCGTSDLLSFPTRRSSDLVVPRAGHRPDLVAALGEGPGGVRGLSEVDEHRRTERRYEDRKSTRLNSSHVSISYAVFCLKKKRSSKTVNKTK